MWLTRVFLQRPTLVLVLLAFVFISGYVALRSLVVQQFPNIEKPVITVFVQYPGASTTEMRHGVVVPIENQIAGTPDLQTIDSTIEAGQATIASTFTLASNPYTDLVYIQKALQQASRYLPSNLTPPLVNLANPSETVVAFLGISSKSLSPSRLSLLVTDFEQIAGISNVLAFGTVTPAYEVKVHPGVLASDGLTITDVTNTIAANNQRLAGGTLYGPARQTNIDVLGNISNPQSIANLLIQATPASSGLTQAAQSAISSGAT